MLKVFLVSIPEVGYVRDYEMVVVTKNATMAEKVARSASCDFERSQEISIHEIDLEREGSYSIANTGA